MSQKRFLTSDEIENILSFIVPQHGIPPDVAQSVVNINKDRLRSQLVNQEVYPEIIPELKSNIQQLYEQSLIQPGECVGIITAQSIGERQTQSSLNTFHKAGSSENVSVVSKFSELLNATKKPKSQNCFIYFKDNNTTVEELRNVIGSSLVQLTMQKIALDFEICIDRQLEYWHESFAILYNNRFRSYTDCISVTIDMNELYKYKITLQEISEALENEYGDIACVYSCDSIGKIDVFVDTESIDLPENRLAFIDQSNVKEIFLEEVVLPVLKKITVAGIEGIEQMFFNRDDEKWMIETEGSNFPEVLAHPAVDMERVLSSNVWDIYDSLGVEAARQFMIEQFSAIMTGINICHIMLLVDKMTFKGTISSISRYTMRKEESGPMGKASFEETLDNFLKAGLYGQHESTQGVSASIICGKRPHIGTGLCELKMDMKVVEGDKVVIDDSSSSEDEEEEKVEPIKLQPKRRVRKKV